MSPARKLRIVKLLSLLLLILTGLNALIAGALFMTDPSGSKMGMSVSYLEYSPFHTYLIPGMVLFVMNGIMNLLVTFLAIRNHPKSPEMIVIQGIVLVCWIAIQVLMVHDFNGLHATMLLVGILLIILGLISLKNREKGSKHASGNETLVS